MSHDEYNFYLKESQKCSSCQHFVKINNFSIKETRKIKVNFFWMQGGALLYTIKHN